MTHVHAWDLYNQATLLMTGCNGQLNTKKVLNTRPTKPGSLPKYTWMKATGCSLILARVVKEATNAKVSTYILNNVENIPPESVIRSIAILDTIPVSKNEVEYSKRKVCRQENKHLTCG